MCNPSILTILELRFEDAKIKAQKYASEIFNSINVEEKCRKEVEAAYYAGKANAYAETIALLSDGTFALTELGEIIKRSAEEVLLIYRLKRVKHELYGDMVQDEFEAGVEALKQKLLSIIDTGSIDVQIIEEEWKN